MILLWHVCCLYEKWKIRLFRIIFHPIVFAILHVCTHVAFTLYSSIPGGRITSLRLILHREHLSLYMGKCKSFSLIVLQGYSVKRGHCFPWRNTPWWVPGSSLSRLKLHIYADIPNSVGLLWTSDQPVTETCTWQHTIQQTDVHAAGGIRIPASERP
jgi:hypothetical protein